MPVDELNDLQRQLEASDNWPPPGERRLRDDLVVYRALRESDRGVLRRVAGFDEKRRYVLDPLAERIPGVWADLIYGEAPTFTAANPSDQDALEALVDANALADQLPEGVTTASSEGEAWWRIIADRALSHPTIEWVSRMDVVPVFSGRQLRAVAFYAELDRPPFEDANSRAVWRYVEYQARGVCRNVLYRAEGRTQGLGARRPLTDHFFTADLEEEWNHGLDVILAGRVRNVTKVAGRRTVGRSDYHGIKDLLLELNEAASIGSENMRLTAKKRIVASPKYLDAQGEFPAGVDIILRAEADDDPDKPDEGLVQLEWSFDASALIEWSEHLTDQTLTRARVAPQLVGRYTEGAQTGPAFRARLLDSLLAAASKAPAWDAAVPELLTAAALVDQLPTERGGFGHTWSEPAAPAAAERASALPVDETERANRLGSEIGSEILSRQTAIEEAHPDWEEPRVVEELKRIERYSPTAAPAEPPF